ncbi:MAG TPA: 7TM diverse intracellular signaling domain-containing protein [bacterium]
MFVPLLILAAVSGCVRTPDSAAPKAVEGVLDARQWDFVRNGPIWVNGAWELHWQRLPADLAAIAPGAPPVYQSLPGSWTGIRAGDLTLPAEGYATYRLRVLLPAHHPALAVRTDSAGTAFELWVNGQRVAGNGTVGTSRDTSRPEFRKAVSTLPVLEGESEWLFVISNFHYRKGGPWNAIELGTPPDLVEATVRQSEMDLFLIGSVVIMGMYHVALFVLRRKERTALYYSLFCAVIACRQASTSGRLLLDLWPSLSWSVVIRVEFISFFLAISAGALFARSVFPEEVPRWAVRVMVAIGAAASAVALVAPPRWSSVLINPYQVFTVAGGVFLLGCIFLAYRHGREGARLFLLGTGVLVVCATNDALYNLEIFRWVYLVSIGFVVFTFAQALVLSQRFVRATVTAETLSVSLERKVEERTAELAAKNEQLETTIEDLRSTRKQLQKLGLSVRVGGDYQVFPYADVLYLTAERGKTIVHARSGDHEVARPLKEIEALLSAEMFQRIHRQCIVNVTYVDNMTHIGNGTYMAMLREYADAPLPVSRVHAPALKERLGIAD